MLNVIKAEYLRIIHKPFFYVVPLLGLLWVLSAMYRVYQTAVALHNFTFTVPPGVPPPPAMGAELSTLLYWFEWGNLPTAVGAYLLAGWGIFLFIYIGAAWFGDDLRYNTVKQIGVLRRWLIVISAGKICAMVLYILAVLIFIMFGALLATFFLPSVPDKNIISLFNFTIFRSFIAYMGIAVLWAIFSSAVTLAANSSLLGISIGVIWVPIEKLAVMFENGPFQVVGAKVLPWSTCQSFLAYVYDRFSWISNGTNHLWIPLGVAPPPTFTFDSKGMVLYLLPLWHLLLVFSVYLILAFVLTLAGYCQRAKK